MEYEVETVEEKEQESEYVASTASLLCKCAQCVAGAESS